MKILNKVNRLYDENSGIPASEVDLLGSRVKSNCFLISPSGCLRTLHTRHVWSHLLNPPSANTHRSFLVFPISVDGTTFTDALHKIL